MAKKTKAQLQAEYDQQLVDEWFICFNQVEAVNRVNARLGREPVSRQCASQHFARIRETLRRRTAEHGEHLNEIRLLAVEKLINLMRGDKAAAYDDDGNPLPLKQIPPETVALITRVSVKPTKLGPQIVYSFLPESSALKLAMQHTGMMEAFDPERGEALSQEEADRELDSRIVDIEAAIAEEERRRINSDATGAPGVAGDSEVPARPESSGA